MPVVLDTSFLVDVARGDPGARARVERFAGEGTVLLIPTVVVAEYLAGSRDPEGDLEELHRAGQVVDFDEGDARAAAELAREASARGRFPGWTDLLIAGVARHRGNASVVTANPRHFAGVGTLSY